MKYFIFFIISFILYIYAPNEYSQSYCCGLTIMFLVECFLLFRKEYNSRSLVSFNILFLSSFFFVTYVYPSFIYGTSNETITSVGALVLNPKYITRAVALSHLAINVYFCGFILVSNKQESNQLQFNGLTDNKIIKESMLQLIYIVLFALTLIIYIKHLLSSDSIAVIESPFVYDLYRIVFTVGLSLSVLKYSERGDNIIKFIFTNKLYILSALLFIIICLIIGDRGPVLYLGTVMASVYILFVKKLKTYVIILSCLIAILLMFLIRETRGTSSSISSGGIASFFENSNESLLGVNSLWNVFVDLTDIHNEMTIGYEYVQKKGVIYPEKIVIVPFYPIPKVPSILSNLLYEKSFNDISSGKVIQQYVSSAIIWNSGTHCVMDIYIHWGIVGVFLFFFVFGFFVGTIYKQSTHNLFCTIIYIAIIAESIYLPRSSILSIVRTVVYVTMTIYICVKCCKKEIIIKESKCHQF